MIQSCGRDPELQLQLFLEPPARSPLSCTRLRIHLSSLPAVFTKHLGFQPILYHPMTYDLGCYCGRYFTARYLQRCFMSRFAPLTSGINLFCLADYSVLRHDETFKILNYKLGLGSYAKTKRYRFHSLHTQVLFHNCT